MKEMHRKESGWVEGERIEGNEEKREQRDQRERVSRTHKQKFKYSVVELDNFVYDACPFGKCMCTMPNAVQPNHCMCHIT